MKKIILTGATAVFIGLASFTFYSLKVEAKGHDCSDDWGLRLGCTYDYVNEIIKEIEPITSLVATLSADIIDTGNDAVDSLYNCKEKRASSEDLDRLEYGDPAGRFTRNYEIDHCGIAPCLALQDFWNAIYRSNNASLKADQYEFFIGDDSIRYHCSRKRGSQGLVKESEWETSDY